MLDAADLVKTLWQEFGLLLATTVIADFIAIPPPMLRLGTAQPCTFTHRHPPNCSLHLDCQLGQLIGYDVRICCQHLFDIFSGRKKQNNDRV
jgi:hypothetical protein